MISTGAIGVSDAFPANSTLNPSAEAQPDLDRTPRQARVKPRDYLKNRNDFSTSGSHLVKMRLNPNPHLGVWRALGGKVPQSRIGNRSTASNSLCSCAIKPAAQPPLSGRQASSLLTSDAQALLSCLAERSRTSFFLHRAPSPETVSAPASRKNVVRIQIY
jgi:hypothetical protein